MLAKGTQLGAFAIKVLAEDMAKDPTVVTMFLEEAKAGLQVNHPHIVQTVYVGNHQGVPFIVFEFVKGVSLATLMESGPLKEAACIWILRQMGQALRALNGKGMVHQDIKPENI